MLEFIDGPHKEIADAKERKHLMELMTTCMDTHSFSHKLNIMYNNEYHFSNMQYMYDIHAFLKELKMLIDSIYHKVQVMGSVHSDPYGHTSALIGQYSVYGEFVPSIVQDSYIRFKIVMDPKHTKILRVFSPEVIYHFLVDKPKVVRTQLARHFPIVMASHDMSLYPTTSYKSLQIQYGGASLHVQHGNKMKTHT